MRAHALVAAVGVGTSALGCTGVLGIHEKVAAEETPGGVQGIQLSVAQSMVHLVRGGTVGIDVTLQRAGGYAGKVVVSVGTLPNGVTADPDPLTFSGTTSTGTVTLRAASAADRGTSSLQLQGLSADFVASASPVQLVVQDAPGSQDLQFASAVGTPGRLAMALGTGGASVGVGGMQLTPTTGTIFLCGATRTTTTASSIALVRLTVDGAPDLTFGTTGLLVINSPGSNADGCNAMFLRPGGGANLAGFASPASDGTQDVLMARYTPMGPPDLNFGQGGFVTTQLASAASTAHAVIAGQSDGYIAASEAANGATFVGYKKNGTIDPTFGSNGLVNVAPMGTAALWLGAQSSGNIVAALAASTFGLLRMTPAGRVDTSFGSNGLASAGPPGARSAVVLVASQPQDYLVAVGTVPTPSGSQDIAVARFTDAGQLDPSFGTGGLATAHFGADPSVSSASSAALQADGSIVVAGQTPTDGGEAFTVLRFTPAGAVDTTFGPGGRQTFDVGGIAQALVIDSVGRIVVAGISGPADTATEIIAYRLWP